MADRWAGSSQWERPLGVFASVLEPSDGESRSQKPGTVFLDLSAFQRGVKLLDPFSNVSGGA